MLIDYSIIGGGPLGLLLAKELRTKYPLKKSIVLFEKSPFMGDMASGRNSGVLHAGLYYPKNSLKLYHCLKGNRIWRNLSQELEIDFNPCGKLVVSTSKKEDEVLEKLYEKAISNRVGGIRWCDKKSISNIEPFAHISKAFFSSTTGILDVSEAIKKLEIWCFNHDVHILKSDRVSSISKKTDHFLISSQKEKIKSSFLFNCAGAEAPDIRKLLNLNDIKKYLVKGNYLKLKKPFYLDSLIYPIAPENLKGLGIHTSFGRDGLIRFGPDTEDIDIINSHIHEVKENRVDHMFEDIQKTFKGITREDLTPDYAGIRAKIFKDGKLYTDYVIGDENFHGINQYYEFLGIESPGITAAPSIMSEFVSGLD